MKLICLLTHGLGDWYLPLSILNGFMKERNISELDVYIDSVYMAFPHQYLSQRETGIKMVESITKNWQAVPTEFFGSDDWHGIPDRRMGPEYHNIKNDFLFYRKDCVKNYMRTIYENEKKRGDVAFISGTGVWSYEWNGSENIPLDFSKKIKLNFNKPQGNELNKCNDIIANNTVLIHARKKGAVINDEYFQKVIDFCNAKNKKTAIIGLKSECKIYNMTYDLRENISVEQTMYLIEHLPVMATSGSMYTTHRFFVNKPTLMNIFESNVDRYHSILKEHIENPNHIIYDGDKPHLDELLNQLNRFI